MHPRPSTHRRPCQPASAASTAVSRPGMTPTSSRPTLASGHDLASATNAVVAFVADLQEGWDRHDAAIADRRLAADVAWGSPYGATVDNYDKLFAIHQQLKKHSVGGPRARYQI